MKTKKKPRTKKKRKILGFKKVIVCGEPYTDPDKLIEALIKQLLNLKEINQRLFERLCVADPKIIDEFILRDSDGKPILP